MKDTVNIYWIDLFCGAGGTSTGIHLTSPNTKVVACVNHDTNAIESHKQNHPEAIHFIEDIRDFKVVQSLKKLVNNLRNTDPTCLISIWASLECTNFSKAKGGQPRDADSRTLAEHMFMYLEELEPDYFWVENVREFMSWGPLDEKGKPVSRTAGKDYIKWIENIKSFGYKFDKKILNSADYGAYQSRERYFAQFAKPHLPIAWPEQTHTKDKVKNSLFPMKKWKAVKEVLDLQDEGKSIFDRPKPLSENTEKRILAGLEKFVANGETEFLKKYYSGRPKGKVISVNSPSGTVTTVGGQALVKTSHFIQQRCTGAPKSKIVDVNGPARTITTTGGNQEIVSSTHLNTYYGNGGVHDIEHPSPTLTTKDRIAKVQAQFFVNSYTSRGQHTSLDRPCPSVTAVPKQNLTSCEFISPDNSKNWLMDTNFGNIGKTVDEPAATVMACRKYPYLINANSSTTPPKELQHPAPTITSVRTHYLVNPAWGGNTGSVENPCCTVVARQDKAPLYVVCTETGTTGIAIYESDTPTMVKIKEFMAAYGIIDIKMRMLKIDELKQIQGFPKDYVLKGNQTEQKKYIGNAVEVNQAKALCLSNYEAVLQYFQNRKSA